MDVLSPRQQSIANNANARSIEVDSTSSSSSGASTNDDISQALNITPPRFSNDSALNSKVEVSPKGSEASNESLEAQLVVTPPRRRISDTTTAMAKSKEESGMSIGKRRSTLRRGSQNKPSSSSSRMRSQSPVVGRTSLTLSKASDSVNNSRVSSSSVYSISSQIDEDQFLADMMAKYMPTSDYLKPTTTTATTESSLECDPSLEIYTSTSSDGKCSSSSSSSDINTNQEVTIEQYTSPKVNKPARSRTSTIDTLPLGMSSAYGSSISSSLSISHSKSSEVSSSTAELIEVVDRVCNENRRRCDTDETTGEMSVNTSEGIEVQFSSSSTSTTESKEEVVVSPTSSRRKELERLKKLRISPRKTSDSKRLVARTKEVDGTTSEKTEGRRSRSSSVGMDPIELVRSDSEESRLSHYDSSSSSRRKKKQVQQPQGSHSSDMTRQQRVNAHRRRSLSRSRSVVSSVGSDESDGRSTKSSPLLRSGGSSRSVSSSRARSREPPALPRQPMSLATKKKTLPRGAALPPPSSVEGHRRSRRSRSLTRRELEVATTSSDDQSSRKMTPRRSLSRNPPGTPSSSSLPSSSSQLMSSSYKHHRRSNSSGSQVGNKKKGRQHRRSNSMSSQTSINSNQSIEELGLSVLGQSIIPFQSVARMYIAQRTSEKRMVNIIRVQSVARRWLCSRNYIRDVEFRSYCVTRVQSAYRGYSAFMKYINMMSKIILVQSVWRMSNTRKKYQDIIEDRRQYSATKIQAVWRRHVASENYIFAMSDVIICQSIVRRKLAMKRCNDMKVAKRRAAIQAKRRAAICIQKAFRGFNTMLQYYTMIAAATVIQSSVRRMISMRQLETLKYEQWVKENEAAKTIQAAFVGYITRIDYCITVSDIITVQSAIRRRLARKELGRLQQDRCIKENEAATKIQTAYRVYTSRMDYLLTISDIITVQASIRRKLAMNELGRLRQAWHIKRDRAATSIQKTFRGFNAMLNYHIILDSTITCQSAIRRRLARKELSRLQQVKYAKECEAATKIQAAFVGYIARINYCITVRDITTVQSAVRSKLARRQLEELKCQRSAAIKIQAAFRGYDCRFDYMIALDSIIICQSLARKLFAKNKVDAIRQYNAATKIRATYLAYTVRMDYLFTVADIITIQKSVRGFNARTMVAKLNSTASKIQAVVRGIQAREDIDQRHQAATTIQKHFRGFIDYENYVLDLACTIQCQAAVRQFLAKVELAKRKHTRDAVTKIQSCWRRYTAQMDYTYTICSVLDIQAVVRQHLATIRVNRIRVSHAMYQAENIRRVEFSASVSIQRWWRDILIQKRIAEDNAAVIIQSTFRGYQGFIQYVIAVVSVIRIQNAARGYLARRKLRLLQDEKLAEMEAEAMIVKNASALAIQTCFRGYKCFMRYVIMQYFIIKIQSRFRAYQAQCLLRRLRVEDRKKQIKKNGRLSDTMSRVSMISSTQKKKSMARTPPSSLPFSSRKSFNKKPMTYGIREIEAALTIERFFIKIKADIDREISRMENKPPRKDHPRKSRLDKKLRKDAEKGGRRSRGETASLPAHRMSPSRGRMSSVQSVQAGRMSSGQSVQGGFMLSSGQSVQGNGHERFNNGVLTVSGPPHPMKRVSSVTSLHSVDTACQSGGHQGAPPQQHDMINTPPRKSRVPTFDSVGPQHGVYTAPVHNSVCPHRQGPHASPQRPVLPHQGSYGLPQSNSFSNPHQGPNNVQPYPYLYAPRMPSPQQQRPSQQYHTGSNQSATTPPRGQYHQQHQQQQQRPQSQQNIMRQKSYNRY